MKTNYLPIILYFMLLLLLAPTIHADAIQINMPNSASMGEVIKIDLTINDKNIRELTEELEFSGSVSIYPLEGTEIKYAGEEKISFYAQSSGDQRSALLGKKPSTTEETLKITFKADPEKVKARFPKEEPAYSEIATVEKKISITPYAFSVNIPGEINNDKLKKLGFDGIGPRKGFEYENSEGDIKKYQAYFGRQICNPNDEGKYCTELREDVTKQSFPNPGSSYGTSDGYYRATKIIDVPITVNGEKKQGYKVIFSALYRYGIQSYVADITKSGVVDEGAADKKAESSIQEMIKLTGSQSYSAVGSGTSHKETITINIPINEKSETVEVDCTSHQDCGAQKCNACGECTNNELHSPNDIKVNYIIVPEKEKLEIKNIFNEMAVFRMSVKTEFETNGKDIEYCDIEYPGLEQSPILTAEIIDEDIYSGFTTGNILDARDISRKCTIDVTKGKECPYIIAPNDRKKPVGVVEDVIQNIELGLIEKKGEKIQTIGLEKNALQLKLLKSGPKINYMGKEVQIQDGTKRSIKFKVLDPDSELVMINAKLIGPGYIFEAGKEDLIQKSLYFTINPKNKKDITIGISVPELSNIDLNSEINSLSMWDMQKEAGKDIAKDVAFATIGAGLDKASDYTKALSLREQASLNAYKRMIDHYPDVRSAENTAKFVMNAQKAERILQTTEKIKKIYDTGEYIFDDIPDVIQAAGNVKKTSEKLGSEDKETTTEKVANIGVGVINAGQFAVGAIVLLPNHIPMVGSVTKGFEAAFSTATNIWKANLKYLAKSEKINRAEEKFFPIALLITAEDMSGWQTQSVIMLKIAYHEV